MLKIRLSIGGAKKRPVYKIVVADSRFPRDGRFIEKLGFFNPLVPKNKKDRMKIEIERVKYWMSQGAKPTTRVTRILGEASVIPMPKAGNNPLKAIPKKDRKKTEEKKDTKPAEKKEAAPKTEEKKDKKPAEKKEAAPKTEEKKDKKPAEKKEAAPKTEEKKDKKPAEKKEAAPKTEEKKDKK